MTTEQIKVMMQEDAVPFMTKETVTEIADTGKLVSIDDYMKALGDYDGESTPNWFADVQNFVDVDVNYSEDKDDKAFHLESARNEIHIPEETTEELSRRFEPQVMLEDDGHAIAVPILYDTETKEYKTFSDAEMDILEHIGAEVEYELDDETHLAYTVLDSAEMGRDSLQFEQEEVNEVSKEQENLKESINTYMNRPDVKERYEERQGSDKREAMEHDS